MTDYAHRLTLPVDKGREDIQFFSKGGLLLANGYERIELGGRGPYIEFDRDQLVKENMHIPDSEEWRIESKVSYYIEFRSNCKQNVKIYYQQRVVDYAKYNIGYAYISPFDVLSSVILVQEKNTCRAW